MNAALREADARREVVAAAEAWRAAGAIDDAALAAVRERFPDDRRRSRPGFRLLFFVFTVAGGLAAWGFLVTLFGLTRFLVRASAFHAALLVALSALAFFAADTAIRRYRVRELGVEEGLVALGLGWGLGAAALWLDLAPLAGRSTVVSMGLVGALLAGAAAWRWGVPLTAAVASAGLFAALYAGPAARASWIVVGAALAAAAFVGGLSPRVAVAHRARLDEVLVLASAALYAAVHVSGLKSDVLGWITRRTDLTTGIDASWRVFAWAGMVAVPAALLGGGLARRHRLALALGGLLALATAASAADALDLQPAWLVLAIGGGLLLAVAVILRRLFAARPERTLAGFTDLPLYESSERRSVLEIAATLAALSPEPRRPEPEPGFRGGGGEFGGGGASGKF